MEQRTTTITSIQQVAVELLEMSQRLQQVANAEASRDVTAAEQVRRMPTAQLRQEPEMWAAYIRGWEDRTAVFHRATSVNLTPAEADRSQSPRRPQPAGISLPISPIVPPPFPLMAAPAPRARTTVRHAPPAQTPTTTVSRTPAVPAPPAPTTRPVTLNAGQLWNQVGLQNIRKRGRPRTNPPSHNSTRRNQ
ncbi:hypothetical protein AGLY_000071 [Aphis glycines]|uniref:Uncharacterized protein n=1 Tax=Aphis glycines TaxID=307491 RepID=A0A6G0U6X7_APHGL|nr:hypothetical protein AGLY_000071 [Aphis glycines]